jgi:hypothetical protein
MNVKTSELGANVLIVIAIAGFVSACAPWGKEPDKINVSSVPAGAEVFVMGEKAGVTPLAVELSAVFPVAYPPTKQVLYGVVELRKPGCRNVSGMVTAQAIAKGMNVTLECEGATPSGMMAAKPAAAGESTQRKDIETRLRNVRELREKGLISEQEEREARQRILHDL